MSTAILIFAGPVTAERSCYQERPALSEFYPERLQPSARQDDGGVWLIVTAALMALAALVTAATMRVDREEVRKAVGKVFTKREEEAEVHGKLAKLKGPQKAIYNALVAELTRLGLW